MGGNRGDPILFFFSSRRRHTRSDRDWSSDVCSSDLGVRTRMIQKKLKNVQELPASESEKLLESGEPDSESDLTDNEEESDDEKTDN